MAGTVNSFNNQISGSYNQIILNAGINGVAISTDASAATVNIATGGAVKTTTLGSTNSTSATTVQSGSTGIIVATSTNGTIALTSGSGAIGIGQGGGTGAVNIGNTTGNTAVTGSLTASTSLTATAGNITATSGNIAITAATTSSVGQITQAGNRIFHTYGTGNTFAGVNAGNFSLTTGSAVNNNGFGSVALTSLTTGQNNYAFGGTCLTSLQNGSYNTTLGQGFQALTSGSNNIGIGYGAAVGIGTGSFNVIIGTYPSFSGDAYSGADSSNICISNTGVGGESHAIRIGTNGTGNNQQNRTYLVGNVSMVNTSAFLATLTNNVSNVTGDGTSYTVIFDNEVYDQNSDFNLGTSTFTAPVTGRYHFAVGLFAQELGVAFTDFRITLTTSNRSYSLVRISPSTINTSGFLAIGNNAYADMDAADTALVTFLVGGSTKTVDLLGDSGATNFFSGMLAC